MVFATKEESRIWRTLNRRFKYKLLIGSDLDSCAAVIAFRQGQQREDERWQCVHIGDRYTDFCYRRPAIMIEAKPGQKHKEDDRRKSTEDIKRWNDW